MNPYLILSASSETSSAASSSGAGAGGGSLESLKQIFANPILYVVLGALVLLIIAFYLFRRFVRPTPNATTIIVRGGKIQKVLKEGDGKYFMVPFKDSVGAVIVNSDKEFSSDKLFINNGPDALYKINYTLKYRIVDPIKFYPFAEKLPNTLPAKLNDELRLYADQGNALILVKDYRENASKILEVINKAVCEYEIEVIEFKINLIEPMGR